MTPLPIQMSWAQYTAKQQHSGRNVTDRNRAATLSNRLCSDTCPRTDTTIGILAISEQVSHITPIPVVARQNVGGGDEYWRVKNQIFLFHVWVAR